MHFKTQKGKMILSFPAYVIIFQCMQYQDSYWYFLKWRNKQGNMTLAIIVYDAFWQTAGSRFSDGNYYWTNFIINRSLVTAWKWGNVKVKDNVLILVLVIKIIDIWFWTLFKKRDFSFRNTVFKVRVSYALMKCGKELEVYVGITLTLWFLTSY